MRMDMSTVTTAIGTLGFPIVGCIAMFVLLIKIIKTHKEESAKMTEAINNNTLVIKELVSRLDKTA